MNMGDTTAQSWFASHNKVVPALDEHKQQALEMIQNPHLNLSDLAAVIAFDPGMSLSLFKRANGELAGLGKPLAKSVEEAFSVLGSGVIVDLITQHPTVTESRLSSESRQAYQQMVGRFYFLLALVQEFISIQGIRQVDETRNAALLHNIGEVYACLFDFDRYRRYQRNFHRLGTDVNSARPVFGFGFRELGRVICKKLHLPLLVSESLENTLNTDRKVRVIQFASDISNQTEEGWNHPAMKATLEVCASYLNQSDSGFKNRVQQAAITAAHDCPIGDVLPAASRLILLPIVSGGINDFHRGGIHAEIAPVAPTSMPDKNYEQYFLEQLQQLSSSKNSTREQLVDLLLDHLELDLHMSRVLLMTPSVDHAKIGTRSYSWNKVKFNTNQTDGQHR